MTMGLEVTERKSNRLLRILLTPPMKGWALQTPRAQEVENLKSMI